jgi:crotonobetainyl-CoA:carnitine CoA-transferase CaiB-like acyl-CoA transferase
MATIGWFLQGFIEDRKRIQLPVDSPLRHKPNKAILQEVIGTSGQVLEAFSPSDLARYFRRRRHATYDELIYRMYMAFKDYGPSSYNYSHEAIFRAIAVMLSRLAVDRQTGFSTTPGAIQRRAQRYRHTRSHLAQE